jgi:DNA-binding beta-propeller fold protein YncE
MPRFLASAALVVAALVWSSAARPESFYNFESGHVRPLALLDDLLYAVDTPDNRLSIFRVSSAGLLRVAEVPVGLEPVAVAVRCNPCFDIIDGPRRAHEAWVINHLSDSASIVALDPNHPEQAHVRRTIHLCDEPRDIVFAGDSDRLVFISAARRGQNCRQARDPRAIYWKGGIPDPKTLQLLDQLLALDHFREPGAPRAMVQVFDTLYLGAELGGSPISRVLLPGDTPRALARTPDGTRVYAAVFHSGNRTTTIGVGSVASNGGLPNKPPNFGSEVTGLVAKQSASGQWSVVDDNNRSWNSSVNFSLPDHDLFVIDASQFPYPILEKVSGVGTLLFNIAVRRGRFWECPWQPGGCPKAYVSNTDAQNHVRFEAALKHHITDTRVTRVDGTTATAVSVNPHIAYTGSSGDATERDKSLALPLGVTLSPDDQWLYVAGFGSGKIGIFATADLDAGNGAARALLKVGAGPTGTVVEPSCSRLYVMNRFDRTISVVVNPCSPGNAAVDPNLQVSVASGGFDPSPPAVTNGRRLLYDATETSAHGDAACASCHTFGDLDGLAWDLGENAAGTTNNPNPFEIAISSSHSFRRMKGPMTTQSLRGMDGAGPMHWRGDKTGALDDDCFRTQFPAGDALDAGAAFLRFNAAFQSLLGRQDCLPAADMQAFRDFALTLRYPPNPVRALDARLRPGLGSWGPSELAGEALFLQGATTRDPRNLGGPLLKCVTCHAFDPDAKHFGGDGDSSFEGSTILEEFKIPHLRNLYQKVGMFGVPATSGLPATGPYGDQVRGFGFLHDGSIATLFDFLSASNAFTLTDGEKRDLEAFLLAFDTGLKPAVGQQVTVTTATAGDVAIQARVGLLFERHLAGDCDVVAKGFFPRTGETRGYLFRGWVPTFVSQGGVLVQGPLKANLLTDRSSGSRALFEDLIGSTREPVSLTLTCVPPGSGWRIGVDRDEDGLCDGDDPVVAKPAAPLASVPASCQAP